MGHRQLILGTAGHIDHGKTTLVRALTGIDTDTLQEEKRRGISIDLGFAHLDLGDHRLGIVDVPGHERFIKNMLAGAAGIDLALLVVATDDSVMPQTREHLAILQLFGIPRGVIVLTKIDLAEPSWIDLVEAEIRDLVAGTFLENAPIVRTSAVVGTGLDDLRATLTDECERARRSDPSQPFRLAVDRSFVMAGIGTVVTGTVWSGRVSAGDEVAWLPTGKKLRIRGIQSHGADLGSVSRGQRAALNVPGVHHTEIRRGHELATAGYLVPSTLLTVRLNVLPDSPRPLKHRGRVRLYLGTQEVMAGVSMLESNVVDPGGSCLAQLYCAEPVTAVCRQPFVIRAGSPLRTIGGGRVLQPIATRIARRDAETVRLLAPLESEDELRRAATMVFFSGTRSVTAHDMCRDAAVPPEHAAGVLERLDSDATTVRFGDGASALRLHHDVYAALRDTVIDSVRRYHQETPLETAVPVPVLVQRLHYLERPVVLGIVQRLLDEQAITGDDRSVALAGFEPVLTRTQRRLRDEVVSTFRTAGLAPPGVADLSKALDVDEEQLRPIVELCVNQGHLMRLGNGMFLHADGEARARELIGAELCQGEALTVSEIKNILGVSRKYAVPICEHLDRIGFTRRVADRRVLGSAARSRHRSTSSTGC